RACQESEAHASIPHRQARRAPPSKLDVVLSSRKPAERYRADLPIPGRFRPSRELYASAGDFATFQQPLRAQECEDVGLYVCLVPKAGEPLDLRFPAESSELAFGIAPRSLLNGFARLLQRHFVSQDATQFAVADEVKRLSSFLQTAL